MLEFIALTAGLLAVYTFRADFTRYSIFTVGVFRRVSRRSAETDCECIETFCDQTVSPGERRRWFREIVVAGMPVVRYGGGVHYYCEDHAAFEVLDELDSPTPGTAERLAISVFAAFGEFLTALPEPESELDDPYENVTANMSTALDLIPVLLIVFVAVTVVSLVNGFGMELKDSE